MKKLMILITALLALALSAACGSDKADEAAPAEKRATEEENTDKPLIAITQIVEHPALDAMQQGVKDRLAELGVDADYSVHIAQGDFAISEQIASQIKGEAPDLVVAITTPSVITAAQKIHDIPIIFTGVTDPVAIGVVKSLEAPGGNVTGMTDMSPMDKHLAMIMEAMPELKALGIIYNAGKANSVVLADALEAECAKFGVELKRATVDNSAAVTQAAQSLVGKVDAAYVPVDNTVVSVLEAAVKVFEDADVPFFAGDVDSVERGAIAAEAIEYYDMGVQTADIAKKVLDGADPATTPVETIKALTLYVNPGAAEAMGLTLPQSLIDRADKVVE